MHARAGCCETDILHTAPLSSYACMHGNMPVTSRLHAHPNTLKP